MAASHQIGEGPARLSITARDHSFRRFFGGNRAHLQRDFTFDIHPPALEVLSGQHYITQGGSECILYRVGKTQRSPASRWVPTSFPDTRPITATNRSDFAYSAIATTWDPIRK